MACKMHAKFDDLLGKFEQKSFKLNSLLDDFLKICTEEIIFPYNIHNPKFVSQKRQRLIYEGGVLL